MSLYVTDTHALVWYARRRFRKLGRAARRIYDRAERREVAIYVPTLALTELLDAVRSGGLHLNQPAHQWVHGLFSTGSFFPADLTTDVVLAAEALYSMPERGDRLIAATAKVLEVPLISRDRAMASAGIDVIW